MELKAAAMAALEALAAPVERGPIAALAVLAAVVVRGRAVVVVWAWRALAALVAVAAPAALAGMQVVSPMGLLVVMLAQAAVVAWVEPLARRARTPRRWSVVLAGRAVTPERRVRVRRVSAAWMELKAAAMAALEALAAPVGREPIAALAVQAALGLQERVPVVVWG
jgi:hypothetical protein